MAQEAKQETQVRTRNRRAKISDHNGDDKGFGVHFESLEKPGETFFADCTQLPGFLKGIVGTITGQLVLSRVHNKLMDSYADSEQVPDALTEAREVFAELVKGVWSQRGEGGPRITDFARAAAALYGKTEEEAQAGIDSLSKEQRAAFQKDPAIAAKIAEIRAAKALEKAKSAKANAKGVSLPKLF